MAAGMFGWPEAWFATPSLWRSFIPNASPVYPGAFGQPFSFSVFNSFPLIVEARS